MRHNEAKSKKTKVLIFYYGTNYGGTDTFLRTLLPAFLREFEVVIASTLESNGFSELNGGRPIKHYQVPLKKWYLAFGSFHLISIILREKVDVLFTQEIITSIMSRHLKIFFPRLRHATSILSNLRAFKLNSPLYINTWLALNRLTWFLVDKYICISNYLVNDYLLKEGIPRERIAMAYCGLAPSRTVPKRSIVPPQWRVGYIGRLSYEKGFDLFLQIAREFVPVQREYQFEAFGGWGFQSNEAKSMGVKFPGFFKYNGFVADIDRHFSELDAIIIPSRDEGFCYVVLEAFNFGVPVICSNVGALPELVIDGESGVLCPPGNIGAFVAAIKQLKNDRVFREKIITGGRERAKLFSARKMQNEYVALIRGLVAHD